MGDARPVLNVDGRGGGAAAALTVLLLLAACRPAASGVVDLDGREVDPLADGGARAVVLLFVATDCPVANRYAPEIRRLYERFSPRGVRFWLVYPEPSQSVETIRRHLSEYGLGLPALRDPGHALVRKTGVRVTPEAAVFAPAGRWAYRGRIDDRFVALEAMRPAAATHDLEDALAAILEGRAVASSVTTAVGCLIAGAS